MKNPTRLKLLNELHNLLTNWTDYFPPASDPQPIPNWFEYNSELGSLIPETTLGMACLHSPFNTLGLSFTETSDKNNAVIKNKVPRFRTHRNYEAAEEFFSITHAESRYLFALEEYTDHYGITPAIVAGRVHMLIKQYTEIESTQHGYRKAN